MKLKYFIIMFLIVITICSTSAYALEINREVLPNGLTVLHSERHNLPFVVLTLLVRAGMKDEPPEKSGLANLTAGLLTEGTENRTSVQLKEEMDYIGANLGASAGGDYTTVNLSVLKKEIDKGFELFSDVLLNPVFPKEEIDRLKKLVKGSLRSSEEEPSFLASKRFQKEVFGEHPYGRVIRGSVETLDMIEREDVLEFYSANFIPNNSILVVAGDITREELSGLMSKFLKGWEKGDTPKRETFSVPGKKHEIAMIDKDLTQATIMLGHLGVKRTDPDYYALTVMNFILGGGGFSSRLMDILRDQMGLTYGIYSSFTTSEDPGMFVVQVQTKNSSAETVVKEILKQMRRIREEEVTDDELNDAKAYITGSFPRRLDTMGKIVGFLSGVEFYGLGLDYIEKYKEIINSVTKEDVQRVARKYLDVENYVLVIVGNTSDIDMGHLSSAVDVAPHRYYLF